MAKFRVTFKDPDCTWQNEDGSDTSQEQKAKVDKVADKFFEWGEYVTIELDTVKKTAIVIPNE